ncbi:MAG: MOSC domain-containing protein [Acidimicrobiales bacterium]
MPVASVVSVNVGEQRDVEWFGRTVRTAIWKEPVAGRIAVRGVNLAGDDQADRRVHGGPDKAVYAYALEDYGWWCDELGEVVGPGTFGENLTTEGLDLSAAVVGERWRVGTTVLEVAQPRQPCAKLGMRMGDPAFRERFDEAGRPGAYLRIVEEGDVGAGDPVEVIHRPEHGLTIAGLYQRIGHPTPEGLQQVVATPDVPETLRAWAARRIRR